MRIIALFACAMLLAACATKYQDMGWTGGVEAEPVMTDVYRIVARGNGYTSPDRVNDFTLLKAAETTIAAGGNYFAVLGAADRTAVEAGQTPSTVSTNVVGRTAFTTVNPGVSYNIVKPGEADNDPGSADQAWRDTSAWRHARAGHRQYHRAPAESTVIIAFREAATRFIGLASIAISA